MDHDKPTWEKQCETCGKGTVTRWHGQSYPSCGNCGQEFNAGGQRLVSDWRGNPSSWDDEVGDLEGYEMQHAGDY
jgi:ribosomal protein S27AE